MGTLRLISLSVVLAITTSAVIAQDSSQSKNKNKDRQEQSQSRRDSKRSERKSKPSQGRDRDRSDKSSVLGRIGRPDSSRDRKTDPFGRSSRDRDMAKVDRNSSSKDRRHSDSILGKQDPRSRDSIDRGSRSEGSPLGRVLGTVQQSTSSRGDQHKDRDSGGDRGKSTRPPLDRANPGFRDDQGSLLGKRSDQAGKSGRSSYGSINNLRASRSRGGSIVIDHAPRPGRGGGLPDWVTREDSARVRYNNRGGYRAGYCQYDSNWRDDYFWYPHYAFRPSRSCTISPWYYYPQLPPYLLISRVIYLSSYSCNFNEGNHYRWSRGTGFYDRFDGSSELNEALRDLSNAFEDRDERSLGRLISRSRDVGIWVDGAYSYSLRSDDFYDLMIDNIRGTRTTRYDITSVRRSYNGATVSAVHEFSGPWGGRERVCHQYRLGKDRYGYYISDFETSQSWD